MVVHHIRSWCFKHVLDAGSMEEIESDRKTHKKVTNMKTHILLFVIYLLRKGTCPISLSLSKALAWCAYGQCLERLEPTFQGFEFVLFGLGLLNFERAWTRTRVKKVNKLA